MNEEGIFLRNSTGVSVHLAPDTLTLLNDEIGSVSLKPDAIEILASDSTIEMTTEEISMAQGGTSEVTLGFGRRPHLGRRAEYRRVAGID